DVGAVGPRFVALKGNVSRRLWVGVGDAGERRLGYSIERLPENGVGGAEHRVLDSGAAHHWLVVVGVHRVLVGEPPEDPPIADAYVGDTHCVAAGTVIAGDADEWIKVVEAAGRIARSGVVYIAVRLLPHMEQPVHHVARKAVIWKRGTGDLKYAVAKVGKVGN